MNIRYMTFSIFSIILLHTRMSDKSHNKAQTTILGKINELPPITTHHNTTSAFIYLT